MIDRRVKLKKSEYGLPIRMGYADGDRRRQVDSDFASDELIPRPNGGANASKTLLDAEIPPE